MAATTCVKCGETLSSKSGICSACGHSVATKTKSSKRPINENFLMVIVLVVAAVAYLVYDSSQNKDASVADPHAQIPGGSTAGMPDMASFVASLPTDFEALVTMGNALMDQGNYAMAVECYSRAVEKRPNSPDVLTDLGACRHALGMDMEAIADFEKTLEYQPNHIVAKFNLGIVYSNRGDTAMAYQWWRKILAENPPAELKERIEELMK